jgi:anti-anti-sigma factor
MVTSEVSASGASVAVKISGAADVGGAHALHEELGALVVTGRDMTIDLDGVECLDGAGVQLLVALKAFVERSGGSFHVATTAEVPLQALRTAAASALFGLV